MIFFEFMEFASVQYSPLIPHQGMLKPIKRINIFGTGQSGSVTGVMENVDKYFVPSRPLLGIQSTTENIWLESYDP